MQLLSGIRAQQITAHTQDYNIRPSFALSNDGMARDVNKQKHKTVYLKKTSGKIVQPHTYIYKAAHIYTECCAPRL